MKIEIQLLQKKKIPELRDFLLAGFQKPPDAEFATESVLEWKYFDPIDELNNPRAFIATLDGRIVASVGICPTWLVLGDPAQLVSALHGIDWLAAKGAVSAGLMVGQRAEECFDVNFAIDGTSQAIAIKKKLGYRFPIQVPTFCRVLRLGSRLRLPRHDPLWKGILEIARSYGRSAANPARSPREQLELRRVSTFGDEVERIATTCKMKEVHTRRTPELLNHYLRYPKKNISGWLLMEREHVRGFALLSLVKQGNVHTGKIADCFMDSVDVSLWRSALHLLTTQLKNQGADMVLCYGTTPWMTQALQDNGFYCSRLSPLSLLDPKNLIPENASFYLTHLEADHAYLQT